VGDSKESKLGEAEAGLLSLNNNPPLLLRPNFALSVLLGTGRLSAGSFTAMPSVGVCCGPMGPPGRRRCGTSSGWRRYWAASRGGGVIGMVIIGFGTVIAGLAGEQAYDGSFLGKWGHCAFGEDVILTGDSGKSGMVAGEGVCVCGPSCDRSGRGVLSWCRWRPLISK